MPGHVFLVRGDVRRLACDAWLMPADARGRVQDKRGCGPARRSRAGAGAQPAARRAGGPDLGWVGLLEEGETREADDAGRRLDLFLDYLLAQVRGEAHLLDARYPDVLSDEEKALREVLLGLAERAPPAARDAPAWPAVAALLARLGWRRPTS